MLSLGLTSDGAVAVPPFDHADEVGWYRYSPTPGEVGPSVLIGHIDAPSGPAVFYRLGAIKPGNTVRVTRADGRVAVFTVTRVTRYPKSTFPINEIYGDTKHPTLRLITCGGPYVRSAGGYQDNTVVFASLDHLRSADSG